MISKCYFHVKIWLCLLFSVGSMAAQTRALATPNPSKEASALYCYIQSIYGKKILSGQMWSGWGFNELNYIRDNTGGKQPAMFGVDFIEERVNAEQVRLAREWWQKGGIPTIMWHMGAPGKGEGYEASKLQIDINRVFQVGTTEYNVFWAELKKKADHLQTLRDANVPILWRPYHELNGNWFWWGKQGPELFKKLWITTYNYMVNERKLNNLIWVLCYTGDPNGSWFPGNQYVDIAGADTYDNNTGAHLSMYNDTKNSVGGNQMPIAFHECGVPPDPDQCLSQGAMWSWWMEWHTSHLQGVDKAYLRRQYNHDLVLTLDELPNIMTVCNTTCQPTTLTASLQINNGVWQASTIADVDAGSKVVLGPQPSNGGTWNWTGCGTTGTSREQTLTVQEACTATATHTNACGAKSTLAFKITIKGVQTCCGTSAPNGFAYCCTNSDPDGDGWGWENAASCVVPGSAADVAQCGKVTEISDHQFGTAIELYPSPSHTTLNIVFPNRGNEDYLISVLALDGSLISVQKYAGFKTVALDVSALKQGTYFLKLTSGAQVFVQKFAKE